jgi:hypothetical protein
LAGSGSSFFCVGHGTFPQEENLLIHPVVYLNRSPTAWYLPFGAQAGSFAPLEGAARW